MAEAGHACHPVDCVWRGGTSEELSDTGSGEGQHTCGARCMLSSGAPSGGRQMRVLTSQDLPGHTWSQDRALPVDGSPGLEIFPAGSPPPCPVTTKWALMGEWIPLRNQGGLPG